MFVSIFQHMTGGRGVISDGNPEVLGSKAAASYHAPPCQAVTHPVGRVSARLGGARLDSGT